MKFVYSLCLAAAVAGLLQSCSISVINDTPTCAGTAEAHARYGAHRDYEVSAFERVMVKGNFCVHFVQGDQYTLHADGMSAQDLQKLTVKCADGLLQVLDRRERAKTHPEREPLCLTITMPYVVSMEGAVLRRCIAPSGSNSRASRCWYLGLDSATSATSLLAMSASIAVGLPILILARCRAAMCRCR